MKHCACASCFHAACTHSTHTGECGSCYGNGHPSQHRFSREPSLFSPSFLCLNCERNITLMEERLPVQRRQPTPRKEVRVPRLVEPTLDRSSLNRGKCRAYTAWNEHEKKKK
jgi:hypothetical protein